MNEDRIVGAGRDLAGKAELAVGDAVGSDRVRVDGAVDRVSGVFQNGYGRARDAAAEALDEAPAVLGDLADRGRALTRRLDTTVRETLGEHGPIYLLAGAIGLVGLGLFALSQSRSSSPSHRTPVKPAGPAARAARTTPPRTPRARKAKTTD